MGLLSERDRGEIEPLYDRYSLLIWNVAYAALQDRYLSEQAVELVFREINRQPHCLASEMKLSICLVKLCREKVLAIQADIKEKA